MLKEYNPFARPLHHLTHPTASQIPVLDLFRTLAVLMVIATHLSGAFVRGGGMPNLLSRLPFIRGGWIGVDLFFVLSGYLIGTQLWKELLATSGIDLWNFVLRRGVRIWPLYFFFFVIVVIGCGAAPFHGGRGWSDLLFVTNYFNRGIVMGSWSLCTEEQFYILAPLVLLLGTRRGVAIERYRPFFWALLLLFPVLRAVRWITVTGSLAVHDPSLFQSTLYYHFHTHCDGLVMGLLISNYHVSGIYAKPRKSVVVTVLMVLVLSLALLLQRLQHEVFDFSGMTCLFGAALWFCLPGKAKALRVPAAGMFHVLSRLSFGMYLNHEYMQNWFAAGCRKWPVLSSGPPAVQEFAGLFLLAAASAMFSVVTYCAIEYPFLAKRESILRWSRRAGSEFRSRIPIFREETAGSPRVSLENSAG